MASPQNFIFAVYDATTGAPKTGYAASLVFATYKDETGANLAQPAITEIGGGLYKFTPVFTTGHVPCFILGTNGQNPQYLFSWLRPEDYGGSTSGSPQIIVFPIYDATTGAPKTGAVPTFSSYDDDLGNSVTPPSIVEIGGGLYKFTPAFTVGREIAYIVATGNQTPPSHSGFIRLEDFLTSGFVATSAVAASNQIVVSFAGGYVLDALAGAAAVAANWAISGPSLVTVTGVSLVANQIVLTTTNQVNGGSYTLNVPNGITANLGTSTLLGPPNLGFIGFAGDPTVLQARTFDERLVDVFFAFPPTSARALDPTQYSISPSLPVLTVARVNDTQYRITTAPQTTGQVYVLTWPTH